MEYFLQNYGIFEKRELCLQDFFTLSVLKLSQYKKQVILRCKSTQQTYIVCIFSLSDSKKNKEINKLGRHLFFCNLFRTSKKKIETKFFYINKTALYIFENIHTPQICKIGFFQFMQSQEDFLRHTVAQITVFLSKLHKNKIVYNNININSILIDSQGWLQIRDFSYSIDLNDNQNIDKFQKAQYEYLSPEILLDLDVTFQVDYWDLGVFLFELSMGYNPFKANNQSETKHNIIFSLPHVSQNFSKGFQLFVRDLLRKDYSRRIGYEKGCQDIWEHVFFEGFDFKYIKSLEKSSSINQLFLQ